MIIFFAFDNGDMAASKRRVTFVSLISILKCMSKSIVIRIVYQLKKFDRIERA